MTKDMTNELEETVRKLLNLAKRKPLHGQDLALTKDLIIKLKNMGYTNREISGLSNGGWSESSIKSYTRGEKVKNDLISNDWIRPKFGIIDHSLVYRSNFSSAKLKFAILMGNLEFQINKRFGRFSWLIKKPVTKITDQIFKNMK